MAAGVLRGECCHFGCVCVCVCVCVSVCVCVELKACASLC